jgi:pimeloyl-ACP methyl ester carboxylesterase
MGKKISLSTILFLSFLLLFISFVPIRASAAAVSDKYTALTEDGVELAMKRYRPDEKAGFREKGQPVILMPGLACNFNLLDVHTPPGKTYDVQLPSRLASWARRDPYIRKDPMRYYSMAHYLWLQGYDVWLANYRGAGREPYMSGGAETAYTASDCGVYDLPALVEKVYEVTKKHPVWGGHSMGAAMAYIYLEGATYVAGDRTRVVFDPALAAERNGGDGKQSLKGFLDFDGTMAAAGSPADNLVDTSSLPAYMDLRPMTATLAEDWAEPTYNILKWIWSLYQMLGYPDLGLLNMLLVENPNDLDPNVYAYMMTYAGDGISGGLLAGFMGNMQGDNTGAQTAYADNLAKITLPALVVADGTNDLTNPEDIHKIYVGKTRNPADAFITITNAAHADLVLGLSAPTTLYPEIGKWLRKLRK